MHHCRKRKKLLKAWKCILEGEARDFLKLENESLREKQGAP
jgi:hypothetical protein